MSNQQRIDDLASLFGNKDRISISLGREKVYPNKDVSDATLERLENALRSPQSENGTIRVLELIGVSTKTELIYRSSQNALDLDPKNVAKQFQTNFLPQLPKIKQVEQSLTVNQWLEALNQTANWMQSEKLSES